MLQYLREQLEAEALLAEDPTDDDDSPLEESSANHPKAAMESEIVDNMGGHLAKEETEAQKADSRVKSPHE